MRFPFFSKHARQTPGAKRIVCLANSFKDGGSCIAGKEKLPNGYGSWIRPISARETAEIRISECQYENRQFPKLLDIMSVPLLNALPRKHQNENHVIDATRRWTKVGALPWNELAQMCDIPASLWMNGSSTRTGGLNNCVSEEQAASLSNSLLLIQPENFFVHVASRTGDGGPSRKCWTNFDYNGTAYSLKLTDPVAATLYQAKGEGEYPLSDVYICVSLTEPFRDGRCHKLAAAIFPKRPLK